jgi:hypothetical protein
MTVGLPLFVAVSENNIPNNSDKQFSHHLWPQMLCDCVTVGIWTWPLVVVAKR